MAKAQQDKLPKKRGRRRLERLRNAIAVSQGVDQRAPLEYSIGLIFHTLRRSTKSKPILRDADLGLHGHLFFCGAPACTLHP